MSAKNSNDPAKTKHSPNPTFTQGKQMWWNVKNWWIGGYYGYSLYFFHNFSVGLIFFKIKVEKVKSSSSLSTIFWYSTSDIGFSILQMKTKLLWSIKNAVV